MNLTISIFVLCSRLLTSRVRVHMENNYETIEAFEEEQ